VPNFRVLPGLPPYGAAAIPVPENWGRSGREGLVVEFVSETGGTWTANFRPGLGGIDDVRPHPNGHDVLVISAGAAWQVDPSRRTFAEISGDIDAVWSVSDPEGVVMSWQGLALLRLGPGGLVWHTRRISWDGFQRIQLSPAELTGLAWAPWRLGCVEVSPANAPGISRTSPNHCSASKPL
jgi:hypothetical protein